MQNKKKKKKIGKHMSGNAKIISKTVGRWLVGRVCLKEDHDDRQATCSRNPFLWQHLRLGLCEHICNVSENVTGFMDLLKAYTINVCIGA